MYQSVVWQSSRKCYKKKNIETYFPKNSSKMIVFLFFKLTKQYRHFNHHFLCFILTIKVIDEKTKLENRNFRHADFFFHCFNL